MKIEIELTDEQAANFLIEFDRFVMSGNRHITEDDETLFDALILVNRAAKQQTIMLGDVWSAQRRRQLMEFQNDPDNPKDKRAAIACYVRGDHVELVINSDEPDIEGGVLTLDIEDTLSLIEVLTRALVAAAARSGRDNPTKEDTDVGVSDLQP